MREIDMIIIHCSATKEGKHFNVNNIRAWHRERGFNDVGYHYVILLDGTVQTGRPIANMGAHALGYNASSIGICYIGGLDAQGQPKDTRTDAQRQSMRQLVETLKNKFPKAKVIGHHDVCPHKACPCFDVATQL